MFGRVREFIEAAVKRVKGMSNPEAPFAQINLALENGDYDSVLRETERIIARNRSISRVMSRRVSRSRMFNSSEEYNNFLRRNPGEAFISWEYPEAPEAHYHRSLVFQRSGRLKSSRGELENCLQEFPDSAKYLIEMGQTLQIMGYCDEAGLHFERALRCDLTEKRTYSHRAYIGIGLCCLELGRFKEARDAFERAWQLGIDNREVGGYLHLLMDLETDPRQRAQFFLAKGHFELALTAFEEALDFCPADFEMQNGIAFALKELQRYDDAIEHLRRAFRSNPGSSQTNFALGWVYLMKEDVDEAQEEFLKAIRKNPYDPSYLIGLAYCYLERMKATDHPDDERLLQLVKRAQELDPSYSEPLIVVAEYHLILDQLDKAREAIDAAIALNPSHQAAHIVAAEIHLEQEDPHKATFHLGEAEEYGRDTDEMRMLRERIQGERY